MLNLTIFFISMKTMSMKIGRNTHSWCLLLKMGQLTMSRLSGHQKVLVSSNSL